MVAFGGTQVVNSNSTSAVHDPQKMTAVQQDREEDPDSEEPTRKRSKTKSLFTLKRTEEEEDVS